METALSSSTLHTNYGLQPLQKLLFLNLTGLKKPAITSRHFVPESIMDVTTTIIAAELWLTHLSPYGLQSYDCRTSMPTSENANWKQYCDNHGQGHDHRPYQATGIGGPKALPVSHDHGERYRVLVRMEPYMGSSIVPPRMTIGKLTS